MMKFAKTFLLAAFLIFFIGMGSKVFAQTQTIIEPKAENFIYFIDNSGSMMFDYQDLGKKATLSRDLLLAINDEVPELEADFGVYTYQLQFRSDAPAMQYLAVGEFDRQAIQNAITAIPTDFDAFGRRTPFGSGLMELDKTITGLQDRIAVVTVTDGESNIGPHPKGVMQDMYAKYGDRICFHFISLAQSADELALVDELAGLNPCSVKADASELVENFVRADFIKDVFYDTREITLAPEPRPEPIITPPAPVEEEVIVFSNITFDFDKAVIRPEYRDILREAAQIIKDRPETTVLIEGHTCNIGPAEYNMGLSQRRAQSVSDFLEAEGVSGNRLETIGYGLTRPRFDNNTREGRALNRRVEMQLQ